MTFAFHFTNSTNVSTKISSGLAPIFNLRPYLNVSKLRKFLFNLTLLYKQEYWLFKNLTNGSENERVSHGM